MTELKSIEFYTTPDGDVMIKKLNEPVRALVEQDREFVQKFLTIIRERYPEAFSKLSEIYTKNSMNVSFFEYKIAHRFIRCNFGTYDQFSYDIDAKGQFSFEEVPCPLRGECTCEGIICKQRLDTKLTPRELEVLGLISDGYQTNEIAEMLFLAPTTVNKHRENIKAKLNLTTISQLVAYYKDNNLNRNIHGRE